MKVFYAAREARFDLYRAIAGLSRHLLKWTPECDRRLHRLMSYIKCTLGHRMIGWVGDEATELNIHCYADANFGTDGGSLRREYRSNSRALPRAFPYPRCQ